MDKQLITIELEEYKELLIIKGKYEELSKKNNTITYVPYKQNETTPSGTKPYWISGSTSTSNGFRVNQDGSIDGNVIFSNIKLEEK